MRRVCSALHLARATMANFSTTQKGACLRSPLDLTGCQYPNPLGGVLNTVISGQAYLLCCNNMMHKSTGSAHPAHTQRRCHVLITGRLTTVLGVSHAIRAMMIPHRIISKSTAPAKASETSPPFPAASLRDGELVATRSNRFAMPNIAPD